MRLYRSPKPAYIDGGLAAMILQGMLGGLFAAAWYLKGYWRGIKSWFSRDRGGSAPAETREGDSGQ